MRAAIATGQSIPGAITPSTRSARAQLSERRSRPRPRRPRAGPRSAKPGAPGSRSQAMTKRPRSRAARRRPSWAGPAPRTRRRFAMPRSSRSAGLLPTRDDSARTRRWCARGRPRSSCARASRAGARPSPSSRCGGRPGPAARARAASATAGLPRRVQHEVRDLRRPRCRAGRDVDHLAGDGVDDRPRCTASIASASSSTKSQSRLACPSPCTVSGSFGERLRDEARDHLLGMLVGPVVVERPHDHDREARR